MHTRVHDHYWRVDESHFPGGAVVNKARPSPRHVCPVNAQQQQQQQNPPVMNNAFAAIFAAAFAAVFALSSNAAFAANTASLNNADMASISATETSSTLMEETAVTMRILVILPNGSTTMKKGNYSSMVQALMAYHQYVNSLPRGSKISYVEFSDGSGNIIFSSQG